MRNDPGHTIKQIAEATRATPFDGRIYAVGGFLRDQILGRPWSGEIDFVVEGDALELAAFLFQHGVSRHPPVTYPRFGTAMIRAGDVDVEMVTARQEIYEPLSRKPDVTPADVRSDALRRDFTINTLLLQIHSGTMLDPTGMALDDLSSGVLRTPLEPHRTFHDDPLRMLRAVRFATQLTFEIDPATAAAIRDCSARLEIISRERIRDEWSKILLNPRRYTGIVLLHSLELLPRFLPELARLSESRPESGRLWQHTLTAAADITPLVPRSSQLLSVALAVCLHHACPPRASSEPLRRLRYPNDVVRGVTLLLDLRAQVATSEINAWSDGQVRRLVRKAGALLGDTLAFCRLDRAAGDSDLAAVDLDTLSKRIESLEAVVASGVLESPLTGDDIMTMLELPPGAAVREAKEWLLDEVLEGRLAPGDTTAAGALLIKRTGRS